MTDWLQALSSPASPGGRACETADDGTGEGCVLITVIRTRGSCPRDAGTRMVVAAGHCTGTIGGGHLEYRVIALARQLLAEGEPAFRIERFALGARLGQCCGGVVHLCFEAMSAARPAWVRKLTALRQQGERTVLVSAVPKQQAPAERQVHGTRDAGHLVKSIPTGMHRRSDAESQGEADRLVVTASRVIGCWSDRSLQREVVAHAQAMLGESNRPAVVWQQSMLYERIDAPTFCVAIFGAGHVGKALVHVLAAVPCRVHWIDSRATAFPDCVPDNVTVLCSEHADDEVQDLPAGSHVAIMTHSHALDQWICEAALKREDLAWCGLIGSETKRNLFRRRLSSKGMDSAALARLTCPIGVAGIVGKHPAEIAIAVAAEMLQSRQASPGHDAPDDMTGQRFIE